MSRGARPRTIARTWAIAAAWLVSVGSTAHAQATPGGGKVDRLSLENGLRIVLVRTERAGPVALTVAVRDGALPGREDELSRLPLGADAPWGDLSAPERGALFTARGLQAEARIGGLATTRTLQAAGDELPLVLHLAGRALREASWDDTALARALARRPPEEGPRAFVAARTRLFPTPVQSAAELGRTPLERLQALERARRQRETVIGLVGDFDVDRAAELVHQHLDAVPRRPPLGGSPPSSAPLAAAVPTAPAPAASRVFAVTLAVRLDGDPTRRRALRAAFDVLVRLRLRALRGAADTLLVDELDEPTAGARLVAIRFVVRDAAALERAGKTLAAALAKLIAEGPTAAELAVALERLAITDELANLSPSRRALETALAELAGERFVPSPAPTPAAVRALLAEGFGEERRLVLREQPSP